MDFEILQTTATVEFNGRKYNLIFNDENSQLTVDSKYSNPIMVPYSLDWDNCSDAIKDVNGLVQILTIIEQTTKRIDGCENGSLTTAAKDDEPIHGSYFNVGLAEDAVRIFDRYIDVDDGQGTRKECIERYRDYFTKTLSSVLKLQHRVSTSDPKIYSLANPEHRIEIKIQPSIFDSDDWVVGDGVIGARISNTYSIRSFIRDTVNRYACIAKD